MKHAGRFFLITMVLVFMAGQPILGEETDASLQDLQLSEGPPEAGFMAQALAGKLPEGKLSLTPAFEPGVDSYTVTVSQPLLTIRARAAAGVKMDISGTASGGGELRVANRFSIGNANDHGAFMSVTLSGLAVGENLVTVEVTDPDGTETRGYKVVLTRVGQSAGDTAQSAQTTKALQGPEAVRPSPEAARQAREERLQEREKAGQAGSGEPVRKHGESARRTVRATRRVRIFSRRSGTRTLTESGEPLKRVRMSTKFFPAGPEYHRFFSRWTRKIQRSFDC